MTLITAAHQLHHIIDNSYYFPVADSIKAAVRCYIWSRALYCAKTWTLRKVDRIYLESLEMWFWKRMEKIGWTDCVRNEEVLRNSQGAEEYTTYNKRKEGGLVISCV